MLVGFGKIKAMDGGWALVLRCSAVNLESELPGVAG
jgi:hypothetical protein